MNGNVLFEKEFLYTQQTVDEAVEIMEHTVFKAKRAASLAGFLVLFGGIGILCAVLGDLWGLLFIPAAVIFYFICRDSFRKEYLAANSIEAISEFWSLNMKLTVYDEGITVYSEYHNPGYIETEDDHNDPEYIEFRDEMNRSMGMFEYPHSKRSVRIYENERVIVIYEGRDRNNPISKDFFSKEELNVLHKIFEEKWGDRYIKIQTSERTDTI